MAAQPRKTVKGRSYGQRRPPLTHILKSILERYPDGGQILKEIIQNADDAGATKVSFLLDSRQGFYGGNSLVAPSLSQFQGPALYAQNNALFEKSDWENLQKLMDSNKKEDPLKVGRFGIGFNSVYHLTGRSYGQRRPPLTHILRSILERYPDGGQILKEIIQNADDAGATKVSFLLDSRQGFYGGNSLVAPSLSQFQGPALYAQNNALFEESDWENLQKLMDSNKKNDPLKVGRFGIGFNSVYHLTDLPSIVSGDCIVFLDPHEIHFGRGETGQQFSLEDELLENHEDQFKPYENVLDCKISTRFYNGTLFRFPLRSAPSDLSKKVYTLKEEAPVILLFLKNIEEIALFETDERGVERHVFTVRLSDSCRREVGEKKSNFFNNLRRLSAGQIEKINLPLDLHVLEKTEGGREVENKWLVYHQVDARNSTLRNLSLELGLLPWVACATPVNAAKLQALSSRTGRIFCFLPLPPDADSRTGLPVHVHGYFGLTDNRR
ncbi:hypothetical protein pdam_00016575, partial [Pocillopora damicornis]